MPLTMWTVINPEYIFVFVIFTELAPAFGNDRSYTTLFDSLEEYLGKWLWFVDDNTAEPNVNRYWTCSKEGIELCRWIISRRVSEKKSANI